jgi:ribosome recycling factor
MIQEIKTDARIRMGKTLDSLRVELAKIRTGRAHPSLLEHVHVDYYGSEVPISQAANVAGTIIRIPLPPLTEERRIALGKVVHHEGENAKIAIRNIRRDANHHLKDLLKSKDISEDDDHRAEQEIQNLTDQHCTQADEIVAVKEKELLEF